MGPGMLLAAALTTATAPPGGARTVCYKATSLAWDQARGRAEATSPDVLARLHRAFRLWQEASGNALTFRYDGFSTPDIDGVAQIPYDGCVHAVLFGERNFHGELAHGSFNGTIPDGFKRGYFFVSREPAALDVSTLAHEIGHALGLPHAAVPESIMFSGPRQAPRDGPRALPEQDGLDLRARWTPGAPGTYSISGAIESERTHPMASVFAVSDADGRSYSARSDHQGRFAVAIGSPGRYRLVARPITVARDLNPDALGGMRESWFVANGASAPDPARAAVLTLSESRPAIRDVRLATLGEAADSAAGRGVAAARPTPPLPAPGDAPGNGRPALRLSFDEGFDDWGPHRLAASPSGDEVRLVPGLRGTALFVGGTGDWLDLPLGTAVSFERGLSLELWLRRADWLNPYKGGSGWQTVAALTTDVSLSITAPGCPLHKPWALHGSVSRRNPVAGETETANTLSTPGSVPPGRWIHVALVYDPGEASLSLYQDGALVDRARGVPPPDMTWKRLRLGTWHEANQAFRGEIDEVSVYDFPRSASDIARAATGR